MIVDKQCTQQVLGCLMKHPQYLAEVDKYNFVLSDFPSRFEKYIFSAIQGLYYSGATTIGAIDIENYLSTDTVAKKTFEIQNGVEYLSDIEDFTNEDNFPYYYNKLKKLNLLKDLKRQGFDISDFYIDDLTSVKAQEINAYFEQLSTSDIIDAVKKKLIKLETTYAKSEEVKVENLADTIDEFMEELEESCDIGLPVQGRIYNEVISGAVKGTLTIRSGSSGLGKTRSSVGDACLLAYPIRYNSVTCKWEQTGSCEKVLFIITEQSFKEIKKMILAYLTDINESRFKYKDFSDREEKVIAQAIEIIKKYRDNFVIVKIPDPNIELVKAMVRENCLLNDIDYVFYDYIFISPALLKEFRGFNLRNDELLLLMATALKDLAVELNVALFTATQVNASADDSKEIRNEASLAGGRATINKADNGAIMARPTKEELDILKPIIANYGIPNVVTDIFKVRSGQWTQVRIWSVVDLGRMKREDLFITDSRLEAIDGFFEQKELKVSHWETNQEYEIAKFIKELND